MDEQGGIYASNSHSRGKFHHSRFLSGGPVAAAGEMEVKDGVIQNISDRSGHYRPNAGYKSQAVSQLKNRNVDTSEMKIEGYS